MRNDPAIVRPLGDSSEFGLLNPPESRLSQQVARPIVAVDGPLPGVIIFGMPRESTRSLTGEFLRGRMFFAPPGESTGGWCSHALQWRCRERFGPLAGGGPGLAHAGLGTGSGAVIAPPIQATVFGETTGSELSANQKKSVEHAIKIIDCLGWEHLGKWLTAELAEGDIEVADSASFQNWGLCERSGIPGIPGEWIYLNKKVLRPKPESRDADSPKFMGPCNSGLVMLAAVLFHEGLHGRDHVDEDTAYGHQLLFLRDLDENLGKCFPDCSEEQMDLIKEEISEAKEEVKMGWEDAKKRGQAKGPPKK